MTDQRAWHPCIRILVCIFVLVGAAPAWAESIVRCQVSYGGETQIIEEGLTSQPYEAVSHDVAGRFFFKLVALGSVPRIEQVKVYVYAQTKKDPVLMHEAKYAVRAHSGDSDDALTGHHYLYAPPLGRELQYACKMGDK